MTTAAAVTAMSSLEECERAVRPLWNEREKLEKKISELPQQHAVLDEVAVSLKRRLAADDKTASAQIIELDRKRRELTLREEGLRDEIAVIDGKIAPIKQQMAELRRAATAAAHEAEFEEWRARKIARRDRLFAHIENACYEWGELRLDMYEGVRKWGNKALSANEKDIMEPLMNPVHRLQQQGARAPYCDLYGRTFEIRSLLPPRNGNGHSNGKPKG